MTEHDKNASARSTESGTYRGEQAPNKVHDEGSEPNQPGSVRMTTAVWIALAIAAVLLIAGYFMLKEDKEVDGKQSASLPVTVVASSSYANKSQQSLNN